VLRRAAIAASDRAWVRRIVLGAPVLRRLALRFVAGGDLAAAIQTAHELHGLGIGATINCLGDHVRVRETAMANAGETVEAVGRCAAAGVDTHVSVKLTRIGLDMDLGLCRDQLVWILERAAEVGVFVRIDMEDASSFERTIAIVEDMVPRFGASTVGVVLQSYRRTHREDLARALASGMRVRLVKGGYRESATITYQERAEIDAAYRADIATLLERGHRPAIATHDPEAIAWTQEVQRHLGLANPTVEFQMLYGVRRDLQRSLVHQGYPVRCYVPYGEHAVGYIVGTVRRLAGGPSRGAAG